MAAQTKSKEEKDLERKRKQREKELKILKAQNEMLEEAKQTVLARDNWGESDDPDGVIAEIEAAQEDNLKMAMSYHKANADEVQSMKYNSVSKKGIEQYERRLKARNLTDEMLHQKELATTGKTTNNTQNNSKRERKSIKTEIIETNTTTIDMKPIQEPVEIKKVDKFKKVNYTTNEWDLSDVPEYVQFDMIPLPSNGECYPIDSPLRSGVIPVSYLTASDENLIHSPNMYRDGKIIDVILSRKIIDKRVKSTDLCKGDRDAVILWLRATGYGDNFPIIVRNPNDAEKIYNTNIKLSDLKYKKFTLKGDENGLFEYKLPNGDIFKFKQTSKKDDEYLRKILSNQFNIDIKAKIYDAINDIKFYFEQLETQDFEEFDEIKLDIDEIFEWVKDSANEVDNEEEILNLITESMIVRTVSINGNTSEDYIRGYIENMRANDAMNYRKYTEENTPGVDFTINVNIPESDGGGSFETFLRIDEFVFRNV